MKTYIITEQDIERLQETFSINDDSWWYNARVDEWVETLEEGEDRYYCECEEKDLNYMCPCKIRN